MVKKKGMNIFPFDKLYSQLNPQQKKAVDTIEGPVMVVAGPGTGKTQILLLRIANILKRTDTKPENILAVTFTESAAASLRRRLADIIGSPAYRVAIHTFHGFCNDIIKSYPEAFPRIIGSTNITEIDQIKILEEVFKKTTLRLIRPFGDPLYYVKPALTKINELKREAIAPERFVKFIKAEQKKSEGNELLKRRVRQQQELASVYRSYQTLLARRRLYDYNDMIIEVMTALANDRQLRLTLQEQYQYILVDEHQDSNNAQYKIIETIGSFYNQPNIFIVGDEKQSIYRFQGASLENFLQFKKSYPQAATIFLQHNYRSSQLILNAAHGILVSPQPLQAKSNLSRSFPINIYEFSTPEAEYYWLASDIKKHLKNNPQKSLAVLYRDNKDAEPISQMLEKQAVPFTMFSEQNILNDPTVSQLLILLQTIYYYGQDEYLVSALHLDIFKIPPLDLYKLISTAAKNKTALFDIFHLEKKPVFINAFQQLEFWAKQARQMPLLTCLETVLYQSGLMKKILQQADSETILTAFHRLFAEAKTLTENNKQARLADFIERLDLFKAHNINLKSVVDHIIPKGARLMTAHKAKGLEFDAVYIVNTIDGHWGNRRPRELLTLPTAVFTLSKETLPETHKQYDDERRLFYVALTRARKTINISYARFNANGRETVPAQYLKEIHPQTVQYLNTQPLEKTFQENRYLLLQPAPRKKSPPLFKDKNFIQQLFLEQGLSVTALNNYLTCPWRYFYTNLIRLPKARTNQQLYGVAVHNALKDFFNHYRQNYSNKNFLVARFVFYLKQEPLPEKDFAIMLAKGKQALAGYYQANRGRWPSQFINEFNLEIRLTPQIKLKGIIDKLEFIDNNRRQVHVIDYKTGQPKTRGELEGTTKNSNGDMKRQLVFYNLLLTNYGKGDYLMDSGTIEFVEPDKKGRYRKETFIINKEEVSRLVDCIKKTSDAIINLDFWNDFCNDNQCEFCRLRKLIL